MRSSLGRSKLRRLAWRYHCLQMAQMRLLDLIKPYSSNLTDQVSTY
ncbi:hypothetical protein ND6B_1001 [Pseudoalteromonas sp. ND6B]|nr:hypothetical protein ND6B_1001 [Pseudoalteromonas sp. ND6B]